MAPLLDHFVVLKLKHQPARVDKHPRSPKMHAQKGLLPDLQRSGLLVGPTGFNRTALATR